MWDNYKGCDMCIIGIPEGKERANCLEAISEVVTEYSKINCRHHTHFRKLREDQAE